MAPRFKALIRFSYARRSTGFESRRDYMLVIGLSLKNIGSVTFALINIDRKLFLSEQAQQTTLLLETQHKLPVWVNRLCQAGWSQI